MADNSAIEWTDATWNPVTGCTKVSRGCDHCYAERFAERWRDVPGHPYEQGFDLRRWPSRLDQPARWRKPRMIFVNSMGDLFHKEISSEFIDKVFEQMEIVNRHIYQVLTKRSLRMRNYLRRRYDQGTAPSHIWCGVSVEDRTVCSRIRHLAMAPASVRFLSLEPLLGPLGAIDLKGVSWVIVGGESGPHARPLKPGWVRQIRDQCRDAEVPFFFKQWGGATPKAGGRLLEGWSIISCPRPYQAAIMASFQWHPDERPPRIEPHSKAKLEVLRAYLRQYFERISENLSKTRIGDSCFYLRAWY